VVFVPFFLFLFFFFSFLMRQQQQQQQTTPNKKKGQLEQVAWFDVEPDCDYASFDGTWSNYLFPSGKLVVTSKDRGLFTMQPRIEGLEGHIQ
jgi:hypothetical protein